MRLWNKSHKSIYLNAGGGESVIFMDMPTGSLTTQEYMVKEMGLDGIFC